VRRAALVVLLLLTLAGCRLGRAREAGRADGAVALPFLPPQGLIDAGRHGVALRDLHGRRLVWLRGFAVDPVGAAQSSVEWQFLLARLQPPLLHGPHGWYRLDVPRHALVPVHGARVPLGASATAAAHSRRVFTVERRGRVLLRASAPVPSYPLYGFRILSPLLVQAGTTLLDVGADKRWELPRGCLAAGFRGGSVILACGVIHGAEAVARLRLQRMNRHGLVTPLGPRLAQLYAEAASLSPDRSWVAVEGDTGCAASYVVVAPSRGGAARVADGSSATNPWSANYSTLLGWTADDRLVVFFEPQHCDEPPPLKPLPHGVYLVDPRTLARTFVAREADAMWSSRTP
jgi:hypothetical protein